MGSRAREYLEEADRYFMLDFTLRLMKHIKARGSLTEGEAMLIASEVPFVIPKALPSRIPPTTQWNDTRIAVVPNDLAREYQEVLARVQKVKAKRWREPVAFGATLFAALPGMPLSRKKAEDYLGTKPSDIAVDYLLWRHFLSQGRSLGPDSVKRMIRLARTPGRMLKEAKRDLQRHYRRGLKPPRFSSPV
jgi:hypothetical protein